MTPRARGYLVVAAARHISIGLCAVIIPAQFATPSMDPIRSVMHLTAWGALLLAVGFGCLAAATSGTETVARVTLVLSAAMSTTWAAGFVSAGLNGELANPALPIVFFALAGKDLVVCAQPLRSPFERLAEKLDEKR